MPSSSPELLACFLEKRFDAPRECRYAKGKDNPKYFESTATLDGATAKAQGRNKREAEQKAAKAVFEKLLQRDEGITVDKGEGWTGTPESPDPPERCFWNGDRSSGVNGTTAAAAPSTLSSKHPPPKSSNEPESKSTSNGSDGSSGDAEAFVNYKGTLYELLAKGVEGALTVKGQNLGTADLYFEATAWLDWCTAVETGRSKREAEQKAAKAVFEKLIERDAGGGGGGGKVSGSSASKRKRGSKAGTNGGGGSKDGWTGTPDAPVAPARAFTGNTKKAR